MICADAKPSIQARRRIHESAPPAPGRGQRVEHEYERVGAVTYLDAWDVHRGQRSIDRLQGRWRNLVLVHTPVHASWLNQAEIYHSIVQRKLLDPNDFPDTAAVAVALNDFERHYNEVANPFEWNFTRQDLADLLGRLDDQQRDEPLPLAA